MLDLHHYINTLLSGELPDYEPHFSLDSTSRIVDRKQYEKYFPDLIKYLSTSPDSSFSSAVARMIFERILPDEPDISIATCLLAGLNCENSIARQTTLTHIASVKLPAGLNLSPIVDIIRNGKFFERLLAIQALVAAGQKGEEILLNLLRRTENPHDIRTVAKVLGKIGGLLSLPVLMARLDPEDFEVHKEIMKASKRIVKRMNLSVDYNLLNPEFWKFRWQGTKESFVGYMSIIARFAGIDDDVAKQDEFAEIFMKEMTVDITPFQSFKELRICTSENEIVDLAESLLDALNTSILLDEFLENTGISESEETITATVSLDLINDYLFTRLRRVISFADDEF